jgi:hypothetical protein
VRQFRVAALESIKRTGRALEHSEALEEHELAWVRSYRALAATVAILVDSVERPGRGNGGHRNSQHPAARAPHPVPK